MLPELTGKRLLLAVAQKPFESEANCFSTLVPVLFDDREVPDPSDFPNNGLVWWMVKPPARKLAEPGRLIRGVLERAHRFDAADPDMTYYQVQYASVAAPSRDDVAEILTVSTSAISKLRDLVRERSVVTLDHPPTDLVLVRWRGRLYGPLRASSEPGKSLGTYAVRFTIPTTDHSILEVPETQLESLKEYHFDGMTAEISLDSQLRGKSIHEHEPHYEFLLGPGLKQLERGDFNRVVLESDGDVLRRVAKDLLSRKRRQELGAILREVGDALETAMVGRTAEEVDLVQAARSALEQQEQFETDLAKSLVDSGLLDQDLEQATTRKAEEYIGNQAARLRADIEARIADVQKVLQQLQKERGEIEHDIESRRRRGLAQLEAEISQEREGKETALRERESRLQEQTVELSRQSQILSQNLQEVTGRFISARDDVVNQFLAIMPLLTQLKLLPTGTATEAGRPPEPVRQQPEPRFELPGFVLRADEVPPPSVPEQDFFQRFRSHVEASGLRYRDIDLLSFHLSVKCCDITVLGGVSGTGKSTLPRLYAEALAGSDPAALERYLMVGVSPAWLDMRDLLGHVNALDAQFYPSECGLYQWLVYAQEEFITRGDDSGLYLACLDEMNLSHVEHYFSGFLQALEQRAPRTVRCFSPQSVSPTSLFAKWDSLRIPTSVRFVGTVNFDETTKQLSLRVLDRTNLVRLRPGNLADMSQGTRDEGPQSVPGPPISTRTYRGWLRSGALDREFAETIDELRVPLAALGCPLNPRRFRAICDFVASAIELCPPARALNLQIAQRLLPQVRGLFRVEAREALEGIESILVRRPDDFSESLHTLHEIRRGEDEGGLSIEP